MTATPNLVTKTEFADLIGKHKSYVTRMGDAGRLVLVGEGRDARVDVEASQALIAQTADPSHDTSQGEKGHGGNGHDGKGADQHKGAWKSEKVNSYNDARTRNELAKAQTGELELAVKLGKLVDAEEARLFAADLAATFRGTLEILPDRLAPELVALHETETVRALLVESFEQVLTDMADKILKWGKA